MKTLLIKYVIPFELIHKTKLKKKRTEEIEDGFRVGNIQEFRGKYHPLFKLYCPFDEKVLHFGGKLFFKTFFQFCLTRRCLKIESSAGIIIRKLRQHAKSKTKLIIKKVKVKVISHKKNTK